MTSNPGHLTARAEVDRDQFFEGLRLLRRNVKPRGSINAVISRQGGDLVVTVGGREIRAAMSGRWEGEARVNGRFLVESVKHRPMTLHFDLRVESGRLAFPGFSLPCERQSNSSPRVLVAVGASLVDLLISGSRHSDEDLERAGLLDAIRDARKTERRLVRQAARILESLGVTEEDLDGVVRRRFEMALERFDRAD